MLRAMSVDPLAVAKQLTMVLEAAWNANDSVAYAAVFHADADLVDIRGTHLRSQAAIALACKTLFEGSYRQTKVIYLVTVARAITDDVVIAHVEASLTTPHTTLPPNDGSIMTLVLLQRDDAWVIDALHETIREPGRLSAQAPAPAPASEAPAE